MPMLLGLVTTLSMLALGFFLGRIWQIRRELLSNQQRADDEIARERQLEKQLLKLQETDLFRPAAGRKSARVSSAVESGGRPLACDFGLP